MDRQTDRKKHEGIEKKKKRSRQTAEEGMNNSKKIKKNGNSGENK
jgi:hypothetical protein